MTLISLAPTIRGPLNLSAAPILSGLSGVSPDLIGVFLGQLAVGVKVP